MSRLRHSFALIVEHPVRVIGYCLALILVAFSLTGCVGGPLLSDVSISDSVLKPRGNGESISINYSIGEMARVWVYLRDDQGNEYELRDGDLRQPAADPYTLRFDGTVQAAADDASLVRQLIPDGVYNVVVRATSEDEQREVTVEAPAPITVSAGDVQPPLIEDLLVFPETISPNADGLDDEAQITYQLPVTATVDITITSPDGITTYPFVTADEQEPTPQRRNWNGKTIDNQLLPDGVYTYTIRAEDRYGNVAERQGPIMLANGGQPEVTITYSNIAPLAVMRGEDITVTMRLENTGDVPIRTYGPPSGHAYSTDDVFSSIEDGEYAAKAGGFWRIGVDWDANSGGGAKRYPYRWAISPRPPEEWAIPFEEDVLMPGEEALITGSIRIDQPERQMSFYVGLIQDGVGFFQDRTGRVIVEVGL